jgi:hypothetical protein
MTKHKVAAEIFGHPIEHFDADPNLMSRIESNGFLSPYTGKPNNKQTRLLQIPMGVESVYWKNIPVIIDPNRFLQEGIIFNDIALKFWTSTKNIVHLPEIKLKKIGSFDFILAKTKDSSLEIDDFIFLEIQSDSTTGTGGLVQNLDDLYSKGAGNLKNSYPFGMNTYNTIKLSFVQMLLKGLVAEKWNKNIAWVMQDFVFINMLERFDLPINGFDPKKSTHYFTYNLVRESEKDFFKLKLDCVRSYSVEELRNAFASERSLPTVDKVLKAIKQRLEKANN